MSIPEMTAAAGHRHRPFLWVAGCFSSGIVISESVKILAAPFFLLTVVLLLLSFFSRRPKIAAAFLLAAVICLGAVYTQGRRMFSFGHISRISYRDWKDPVFVEGVVDSDVEPRPFFKGKKTVFTLEVKRIKTRRGWQETRGVVLVNLFRAEDIRYGDYLALEGKLHRPFNFPNDGNFSYSEYLSRKGIRFILSVKKTAPVTVLKRTGGSFLKGASLRCKQRMSDILKKYLPKEEAGLMQAFLLGDRYDIPEGIYELFKVSGVAHIIAISGFNIGIAAYVLFLLLKMFPIPRRARYTLTMALLMFYAFLTGGQPPVVRAVIMAAVFLMSFLLEREPEAINTLALAALILLLMNPLNLFDAGFQLSFISVLFILIFYPRWMGLFDKFVPGLTDASLKGRAVRYLFQSLALSLSAYLGVIVLVAYYFRLITPVVVIANLVVVPAASLLIFLGMGLLAAGAFFPWAAFAFADCITVLLNGMVACVFLFVQIPGAYFPVSEVPFWVVPAYYGLFCLGLGFLKGIRPKIDKPRRLC